MQRQILKAVKRKGKEMREVHTNELADVRAKEHVKRKRLGKTLTAVRGQVTSVGYANIILEWLYE